MSDPRPGGSLENTTLSLRDAVEPSAGSLQLMTVIGVPLIPDPPCGTLGPLGGSPPLRGPLLAPPFSGAFLSGRRNYRSGSNARQDSKRHAASGAVSGRSLMYCLAACRTSNQFEAQMRRTPSGSNPIMLPK